MAIELTEEQMVKVRTWAIEVVIARDSAWAETGMALPQAEDQLLEAQKLIKFVLGE
jgi:hypothetical protein